MQKYQDSFLKFLNYLFPTEELVVICVALLFISFQSLQFWGAMPFVLHGQATAVHALPASISPPIRNYVVNQGQSLCSAIRCTYVYIYIHMYIYTYIYTFVVSSCFTQMVQFGSFSSKSSTSSRPAASHSHLRCFCKASKHLPVHRQYELWDRMASNTALEWNFLALDLHIVYYIIYPTKGFKNSWDTFILDFHAHANLILSQNFLNIWIWLKHN